MDNGRRGSTRQSTAKETLVVAQRCCDCIGYGKCHEGANRGYGDGGYRQGHYSPYRVRLGCSIFA